MSSSEDAFRFLSDWLNLRTKLAITLTFEGVVVAGVGSITFLDEDSVQIGELTGSPFSLTLFLRECTFERFDPERDKTGLPALDDLVRETDIKFGWEITLPANGHLVLLEVEQPTP